MTLLLRRMSSAWAMVGGILVLLIVLVTAVNVSAFIANRITAPFGVFVPALPGYEDFVRLAVSVAALAFIPFCQYRRGHVAVDLFVQHFPPMLRGALDRLWLLGTAAVAIFLGYWLTIGMIETRADDARTAVLGWSEWPWYAPGIVSMGLWALVSVVQAFEGKVDG